MRVTLSGYVCDTHTAREICSADSGYGDVDMMYRAPEGHWFVVHGDGSVVVFSADGARAWLSVRWASDDIFMDAGLL